VNANGNTDLLRTVYAARLAVCEILEAGAPVPAGCSAFIPTHKSTTKQIIRQWLGSNDSSKLTIEYPHYNEATFQSLPACTHALFELPQYWISYSNSVQNAAAICHAMQAQIEQGEMYHGLFKARS